MDTATINTIIGVIVIIILTIIFSNFINRKRQLKSKIKFLIVLSATASTTVVQIPLAWLNFGQTFNLISLIILAFVLTLSASLIFVRY